jgi:hypothetical protein
MWGNPDVTFGQFTEAHREETGYLLWVESDSPCLSWKKLDGLEGWKSLLHGHFFVEHEEDTPLPLQQDFVDNLFELSMFSR